MSTSQPRLLPMIEPLEDRRLCAATKQALIGDVGTYIGTAKIRTSLKGTVRKTGITLTIATHKGKDNIVTGTLKVGSKLTFNIKGSVHDHDHKFSFAINEPKVGSGIYSAKLRQTLHVAEGYITLKFAKFTTSAKLDFIFSPSSTGSGTGGTGTPVAVNPPTVISPPTGATTTSPVTSE